MTWEEIVPLIDRARAGDKIAFGELVEKFQPAVQAVAFGKLHNLHEAIELTQEVFIHALKKLGQLRESRCFVGWLKQITVRMAYNRIARRPPCRGTEPEVLQNTPDAASGPLEQMIRGEVRTEIWSGLEQLKPIDRATLVAFYIRGQTLKEMSREFETPIGTIKRRLHVARHRLRRVLEETPRGEMAAVL